jgi:PhnB protein
MRTKTMTKTKTKTEKLPRPAGHHVVTPAAVVPGAAKVIEFVRKAFGGEIVDSYEGPDGVVFHAEVMVGDSVVMIGEPTDAVGPMPASFSLYVDDADAVDATYQRALDCGALSVSEPSVQPWGYRSACAVDQGGNRWTICTVVEQLTHDEIVERMQAGMAA